MPYKDETKRKEVKDKYRLENAETVNRNRRKSRVFRTYGLSEEGFEALWDRQGGRCVICGCVLVLGTPNGCHIDHNHETGTVRGLLCGNCNKGLGMFKDNPGTLRKAADYVAQEGQL